MIWTFVSENSARLGARLKPTTPEPTNGSTQTVQAADGAHRAIHGTSFVLMPCVLMGGTWTFSAPFMFSTPAD